MPSASRVLLAVAILAVIAAALYYSSLRPQPVTLKVFHAGSLTLLLSDAKQLYEAKHHDIVVECEASGSVKAVRKVSDLGKWCDVVMVADYRVIEKYLFPKYADWLVAFCSNEVVLCYTGKSRYADTINSSNWYEILMKPDVKFGFSNPNMDPCGYRALSILYMASLYYNRSDIWIDLVKKYLPNVYVRVNSSGHYIFFPEDPGYRAGSRLVLRDKSVDLVSMLEAGVIDFAFEYKNVAKEHGLKYVELPKAMCLSEKPFVDVYVVLYAGDPQRQRTIKITRILYGLTIPKCSHHPREAAEFVKFMLSDEGRRLLEEHGFVPIPYEYIGSVPSVLRG